MFRSIFEMCFSGMLSVALMLVAGCLSDTAGPGDDNTNQDNGNSNIPPEITYVNIVDGDRITDRNVLISWKGNTESTQYSYQIDNASWAITTDTSVTFHDLDEGPHTFRLEPQNEYYTGERIQRTFTIDAVLKPGIYFSPRKMAAPGNVLLYFDEVSSLMGAHIEIAASLSCAELDGFTVNNDLGSTVQVFANESDSSRLVIDLAYLGGKDGISGTFLVGSFTVIPVKNGEITIDPSKTFFRNVTNNDVIVKGLDSVRIYK